MAAVRALMRFVGWSAVGAVLLAVGLLATLWLADLAGGWWR